MSERAQVAAAGHRVDRGDDRLQRLALERAVPDQLVLGVAAADLRVAGEPVGVDRDVRDLGQRDHPKQVGVTADARAGEHERGQPVAMHLPIARAHDAAERVAEQHEREPGVFAARGLDDR